VDRSDSEDDDKIDPADNDDFADDDDDFEDEDDDGWIVEDRKNTRSTGSGPDFVIY